MARHTRRSFVRKASVASVGALMLGYQGNLRAAAANEKVSFGVIGCGDRGGGFCNGAAYVCETDKKRLANATRRAAVKESNAVTDMRRILDDKSVDAVFIATPDHWHAPAAVLACEAGKHVYVEKPCSHNLRESRLLLDAARRNKVVVQHGTQHRSNKLIANAVQMLREGVIGDVLAARAWNVQRRGNIGHAEPSEPPPDVDYDTWVGPAEFVPFQKNRFHYNWHWWYNFGTGDIGNDGTHEIDYARWGLGVDTLPSKIVGLGGKYFHDDDQEFPDMATCVCEYPGDGKVGSRRQLIFEMRLWSTNYPYNCDSGAEYLGTKGKMFVSKRGKLEILGERNQKIEAHPKELPKLLDHRQDFFDAIRTGRRQNADSEEAHRSVAVVHLANVAVRLGRSLEFDPQKEQVVGDEEASKLLSRKYRKEGHWAVPKGV